MIPSGLVITRLPVPVKLTATNKPLPYVIDLQLLSTAAVRPVQVIPSGLVITRLPVPVWLTATNKPLPYVIETHSLSAADVRLVQVNPSVAAWATTLALKNDVKIMAMTAAQIDFFNTFNNSPLQISCKYFLALGLDKLSPVSAKRGR